MYIFKDYYQNTVQLSFHDHPFSEQPKHVFVICRFGNKWLLTKHKRRGLEFPGGKVERREDADHAAIREVKEETGGIVRDLTYVGQYFVDGKKEQVIKNVYFAIVEKLVEQDHYFETDGPVLFDDLPKNIQENSRFSFLMKDGVLTYSLQYIQDHFLL